jgi:succinate dehydrogenase / fumarate reductase cytochrome b subunit
MSVRRKRKLAVEADPIRHVTAIGKRPVAVSISKKNRIFMSSPNRPLSPHLSVYRWPITMTMSILHRMTGVALAAGLIVLVVWLESAASGDAAYQQISAFLGSLAGRLLLVGWTFAFFFHMANGIRHLVWDAGYGFEKNQANASSWVVLVATVILTLGYWLAL